MEKRRGDYGFITCQRIGLADGACADATPNAAGGEGGHGAAKLDPVIHRYVFYRGLRITNGLARFGHGVIIQLLSPSQLHDHASKPGGLYIKMTA